MKKIKRITKTPPLDRVALQLIFYKNFELSLTKAAVLAKNIQIPYEHEPNLALLPILKRGQTVDIPSLGYLRFSDKDGKKLLDIGREHITFTYTTYSTWENLLKELIGVLKVLKESLDLTNIKDIYLTYFDKFIIPNDLRFNFKDYFTVTIKNPEDWDLLPHDIFIGVLPYEINKTKLVLRLRSLPEVKKSSEDLKYILETSYIDREVNILVVENELERYLNDAHKLIEHYFIEFLTEEYLNKLGIEIE